MVTYKHLERLSKKFHSLLEYVFQKYGKLTYNYPFAVLAFSIVLFMGMGYGFTLYKEELDEIELWIPRDAQLYEDIEKQKEAYDTTSNIVTVYVTGKEEGQNVLTTEAFFELIEYETGFRNTVSKDGVFYNDLCIKSDDVIVNNESFCYTKDYALMFYLKSDASFEQPSNVMQRVNSGKGTTEFFPPGTSAFIAIDQMFGKTYPEFLTINSDGTNDIQEAEATKWDFFLANNKHSFDFNMQFEGEIDSYSREFNTNSKIINLRTLTPTTVTRDQNDEFAKDMRYLYLGIALIILYSFYVLGNLNFHRSRLFMTAIGLVSVVIAYVETIGLGTYLGLKGNNLLNMLPFMLLGIGVDDMFVLISSLNQAPLDSSGEEKMKFMMKNAGVSITITSLTNFAAFAIGSISSLPGISNCCWFIALGMILDYVNQITFFLSILALDIRRSEAPRGDCCGLVFCKPDSAFCCKGKYIYNENGELKQSPSYIFFSKYYGPFLMRKPVKILIFILFNIITGLSIYALTEIKVEFNYYWFARGTYTEKTIELRDEYFEGVDSTLYYYSTDADFSTIESQRQLESLFDSIENCYKCEKQWIIQGTTDSWYRYFKDWVSSENCVLSGETVGLVEGIVDPGKFHDCLKIWEKTDGFLYDPVLVWDNKKTKLTAGFMTASIYELGEMSDKIQFLGDSRRIAKEGPGYSFPINVNMPQYEHDKVFFAETIIQLAAVILVVFVIMALMNADLVAGFLIVVMVGLTIMGQLALIYFWGEYMNLVCVFNIVVAVGVSVDYCAHFVHAFKTTKGDSKDQRVVDAFAIIGKDIFNGGFSTFLAIVSLCLSKTYIFTIFFKCWFSLFLYGIGHALVFLPVLLSILGPSSVSTIEDEGKEKDMNQLSTVQNPKSHVKEEENLVNQ